MQFSPFLRTAIFSSIAAVTFTGPFAPAAEIAAVSGLYKSEKSKTDGKDAGGSSEITLGARYSDSWTNPYDWFFEPTLTMRSYDAADGEKAASDSASIKLKGGVRWYFNEFSESVTPFVSGAAGVISEKKVVSGAQVQERSGLFYFGSAGVRLNFSKKYFADLECELFESALFSTTKQKPVDSSKGGAKTETTSTDLFVDTKGGFTSTTVSLGMKL